MVSYEPYDGQINACTICGALVAFPFLVQHTRWHEIMEPAWPLAETPEDDGQEKPSSAGP